MIEPRGALGAVNYGSGGPNQSDAVAILYSSGMTGKIKGVVLTHWNIITLVAGFYAGRQERAALVMLLVMVLLFHVFGFSYCLKAVAMGEIGDNGEVRGGEDGEGDRGVQGHAHVSSAAVGDDNDEGGCGGSIQVEVKWVLSGGAPLGIEVIQWLKVRFSAVQLGQGYGMAETSGGAFWTNSPEKTWRYGSVGRFSAYIELKIMDPVTGIALSPCKQGELWLRCPTITRVVEGRPVREARLPCCGIGLGWFLYLLTLKSYVHN